MKKIDVPRLPHLHRDSPLPLIAEALDALPRQQIAEAPWPDERERPEAGFSMAYNGDCIFLRYQVRERAVRATYRKTNDPVYKDSCVEFFVAFGGERAYYNLEFNCLGTCLAGFGQNRQDRRPLPARTVSKIRRRGTLMVASGVPQHIAWQLTLAIPAEVFSGHRLRGFGGVQARANFYKCGDDLPEPHYLAWSPVRSPEPDFHLPGFFGQVRFL